MIKILNSQWKEKKKMAISENYLLFIKSLIYRVFACLITTLIVFIVSGDLTISLVSGALETLTKIFSYFLFDKLWLCCIRFLKIEVKNEKHN